MQTDTPMLADASETSLVKHMTVGALFGVLGWSMVTLVIARLGWPEGSWGFALTLCAFASLWVGPFFGIAGGVALHQLKAEAKENAAHATSMAPLVTTSGSALSGPLAPAH